MDSPASPTSAAASPTLARAVQALLQRRCAAPVELVETHLSWVFLTPRLAFKLKKPVRLPFVDFSTPALREHFCREELRLNRRFAPRLYLRVLALRGSASAPDFAGPGQPIDHLLCMRRFPDAALLADQLASGRVSAPDLERFGLRLAESHARSAVAAPDAPLGWPEQTLQAMLKVLAQLRAVADDDRLRALDAWVETQAWALWELWLARRRDGFVRECHGDLHLGNVARIDGELRAFDCLEFDPGLRWIDVMSDAAFLAMDLQAHGRADLGFRFLDGYLGASGDYDGLRVLRFHAVYRALVRALVARLAPAAPGPDYLACALQWATGAAPRLLITHGVSGSGKSTLAAALLAACGAIRVRSDVERRRLGQSADQRYGAAASRLTYEGLARAARSALAAGFPVIVDAAFLRAEDRAAFGALAARMDVPFSILSCAAPLPVLRQRVEDRRRAGVDPSEATVAVLDEQIGQVEALTPAERCVAIDASAVADADELARCWRAAVRPA